MKIVMFVFLATLTGSCKNQSNLHGERSKINDYSDSVSVARKRNIDTAFFIQYIHSFQIKIKL